MDTNQRAREAIAAERVSTNRFALNDKYLTEIREFFGTTPHLRRTLGISTDKTEGGIPSNALHKIFCGEPQKQVYVDIVEEAYRRWRKQKLRFAETTTEPLSAALLDDDDPEFKALRSKERRAIAFRVIKQIARGEHGKQVYRFREPIEALIASEE